VPGTGVTIDHADRGVARAALVGRLGARQRRLELAGNCHDHVSASRACRFAGLFGEERKDDSHLGGTVAPHEGDLAGLEQRVHRYGDGSDAQDRVVDDREEGHVRHDHGHPIAGGDTAIAQRRCESGGGHFQFGVAEHRVAWLDRRQLRGTGRTITYPGGDVDGGGLRHRRHATTLVCGYSQTWRRSHLEAACTK